MTLPGRAARGWLLWAATLSAAVLLTAALYAAPGSGGVTLLLSADTEGQVTACATCAIQAAPGGLARRATLVADWRRREPSVLLVDAGNAFIGVDSVASGGRIIVSAYGALRYDAVNLCYRDFRLGKARTLEMIRGAAFPVVSCNLIDESTGQLVAAPFVVRQAGTERVAILGVTERPGSADLLPHLASELAGIRVRPPTEALSEWLPKARREAGRVVLLFYGSASGLAAVRQTFGADLAAVLVGGIPAKALPSDGRPPVAGTAEHGRRLAAVQLGPDGGAEVRQVEVAASLAGDAATERILRSYGKAP